MQQYIKYIVTYLGDYPCGHRHPLQMTVSATNAQEAINKTNTALSDERIDSTNHSLFSVIPDDYGAELKELDICHKEK